MSERVFLNEGGVLVTNARVSLRGQTFAMANVTSARVRVRSVAGAGVLLAALGGFALALAAWLVVTGAPGARGAWICAATGFAEIAIGVLLLKFGSKADLMLGTAGGEQFALRGSPAFITQVAAAVTSAIVSRG